MLPGRAGRVTARLGTTDEINHGPSPQKPSCCLPHPRQTPVETTPRMNIFFAAPEAASMTGLGTLADSWSGLAARPPSRCPAPSSSVTSFLSLEHIQQRDN